MTQPIASPVSSVTKIRVFVDYWNFQLTLNEKDGNSRFPVAWAKLGPWLASKAASVLGGGAYSFEGVIIYASHNPSTVEGRKFYQWATSWLDKQAGVDVHCRERKAKALPKCPSCHREIRECPHGDCQRPIVATVEKGVDTLIATDMIRLAWEGAYDAAVLATLDSDLIPAVEFLNLKGKKVIQAGFPPKGIDLAKACWGSFDVYPDRAEIQRPPKP